MKHYRLTKLNQTGIAHVVLPVVILALVAIVGARILMTGQAAPLTNASATNTNGKIWSGNFTINGNGTGYTAVGVPAGAAANYSNMSLDGKHIAYLQAPGYNTLGTADIKPSLSNAKTIATLPSTNHYLQPPVWSPNGTWLAVVYANPQPTDLGVWLVKSDGSSSHALTGLPTGGSHSEWVSWMPNSNTLLYAPQTTTSGAQGSQICTINVDGTNNLCTVIQLGTVTASSSLGVTGVSVSSDGSKVLLGAYNWVGGNYPAADIYEVNVNGTGLKKLTTNSASQQEQAIVWSPDRTKVAYILNANASPTPSDSGLYVMHADGTHQTKISSQLNPDSLSWAHQ